MFLLITLEAFSQSNLNAKVYYDYSKVEKTEDIRETEGEIIIVWRKSYLNFKITQGNKLSYFILVPPKIEIKSGDFWETITFKCIPQNNESFMVLVETKVIKGFVSISLSTIEYNIQIVYE